LVHVFKLSKFNRNHLKFNNTIYVILRNWINILFIFSTHSWQHIMMFTWCSYKTVDDTAVNSHPLTKLSGVEFESGNCFSECNNHPNTYIHWKGISYFNLLNVWQFFNVIWGKAIFDLRIFQFYCKSSLNVKFIRIYVILRNWINILFIFSTHSWQHIMMFTWCS
jgi:hypothetical protein